METKRPFPGRATKEVDRRHENWRLAYAPRQRWHVLTGAQLVWKLLLGPIPKIVVGLIIPAALAGGLAYILHEINPWLVIIVVIPAGAVGLLWILGNAFNDIYRS